MGWKETELNQFEPYKAQPRDIAPENSLGSCLLFGCLFSFVLMLVLMGAAGFTGYRFFKKQVNQYTAEESADLPIVEYSEEDLAALESRIEKFRATIENGEMPEVLVLTADDINALIAKKDELRGNVHVSIQEGQILGEVSIPTDFVPGGKGRYFNASATLIVSLDNGVLIVTLADATVKGERVPHEIIEGFGKENLAKDIGNDPEVAEMLDKFDSLTIEGDKIILTPRLTSNNVEETEASSVDGVSTERSQCQNGRCVSASQQT